MEFQRTVPGLQPADRVHGAVCFCPRICTQPLFDVGDSRLACCCYQVEVHCRFVDGQETPAGYHPTSRPIPLLRAVRSRHKTYCSGSEVCYRLPGSGQQP
eukprot:2236734-Rhodomonas_salina.2